MKIAKVIFLYKSVPVFLQSSDLLVGMNAVAMEAVSRNVARI